MSQTSTVVPALLASLGVHGNPQAISSGDFANPPLRYRPVALYWLNDTIANDVIDTQLTTLCDKDGYGGLAILPVEEYWEPEFMDKYGHLLKKLDSLGMWAIFCDDKSFPSGTAGGFMRKKHPELCSRRLYKKERDVTGPSVVNESIPAGTLMACVAMDIADHRRRIDLAAHVKKDTLVWQVPAGDWKLMYFTTDTSAGFVDYLNPEAVDTWIGLTYQRFYDRFPTHFGTTIKSSFYDDIAIYQANPSPNAWEGQEHTCWTDAMNERFREKFNSDPATSYPALWYDIGPETAIARYRFFALRAEMLSDAFVGSVARWCANHGIDASGHPAGDYDVSPVAMAGDAIKFYRHAQRPLVDVIFHYGQGRNGYKLASSAACLYDRPLVQCETYGAFNQNDESGFKPDILYRTAMELFTRGINVIIPHGVWYKYPAKICPPEISWRNGVVGPSLPDYSAWVARCQLILQGGRHVADIAVLYPIAGILADAHFGGEKTISDYQEVGNRLTARIRNDFTFMHPEVLDAKCTVDPAHHTLRLNNAANWENYRALIIPGRSHSGAINVTTLQKAKEFYDNGGVVICTSQLPCAAVEPGKDDLVRSLVRGIFGIDPKAGEFPYTKSANARGGTAYFIPNIDEKIDGMDRLTLTLNEAIPVWDVRFENATVLPDRHGEVSYIHKVMAGHDYYFFANSSDSTFSSHVRLRGKIAPESMDPHTGRIEKVRCESGIDGNDAITAINLTIGAQRSVFIRDAGKDAKAK
jgi:hypothetical protein